LKDRYPMSRQEPLDPLIVPYGVRSAEERVFGEIPT
jgi:hypothetical protein